MDEIKLCENFDFLVVFAEFLDYISSNVRQTVSILFLEEKLGSDDFDLLLEQFWFEVSSVTLYLHVFFLTQP